VIKESQIASTRRIIKDWQKQDYSICLVPTMGYFHDGHIGLMEMARKIADKVVVSLFVNPIQFGPDEDLNTYPQDLEGDSRSADNAGVDLLFCPGVSQIYQENHQTTVDVPGLAQGMCGLHRPGHFRGVTTVVSKLFNIIEPNMAIFGEKDYQQLAIIRKMVADLNFPVKIIGHPIVRETDGLAMSSRNAYLNPDERNVAVVLSRVLDMIRRQVQRSETALETKPLVDNAEQLIQANHACSVDYLTIVDSSTLQPKSKTVGDCRVAGAIKINNRIRLIDNMPLSCRT
jgi:pantoate--beta-alanine ligase